MKAKAPPSYLVRILTITLATVASHFCGAQNCVPIPTGTVSWWAAEANADDSLSANPGRLYGNTTFTNGLVGKAFRFDGSSGHIRVADSASLRLTHAMTLEAWVNPSQYGAPQGIVTKWDAVFGPSQRSYTMPLDSQGRPSFGVSADGTAYAVVSVSATNVLPLNEWTHVAGTYDGAALRIFVNGVLRGQVAYNGGIFPGSNDLAIGGVVGGVPAGQMIGGLSGLIDEPAIYSRALGAEEIQAIYAAGSVGKCGRAQVLVNGSFEDPAVPADSGRELPAGDTSVTGWTIGGNNPEAVLMNWSGAADGAQCILLGTGPSSSAGTIAQTFLTKTGQTYRVTFRVGNASTLLGTPAVSALATVTAEGSATLGSLAVERREAGWLGTSSFEFRASGAKSTLTFLNTTSNGLGILALDAVRVEPISPVLSIAVYSVSICWDSASGTLYQLQKQVDISGEKVWTDVGEPVPGDGKRMCVQQMTSGDTIGLFRLSELP